MSILKCNLVKAIIVYLHHSLMSPEFPAQLHGKMSLKTGSNFIKYVEMRCRTCTVAGKEMFSIDTLLLGYHIRIAKLLKE